MATSRERNIELDHLFFVPEGLTDVNQAEIKAVYEDTNDDNEFEVAIDESELGGSSVTDPSTINVPSSMTIVSQQVSIASDGTTQTDVVIEFPDALGFSDVEVRYQRIS